ncbi:MAG: component of SufBCD complex [Pseudomonadota bacterium]
MDILTTLTEVIDLRSFSNLWFWIGLAVVWSSASYWVLGVPVDMIQRAKKHGGQAQADLETVVEVKVRRMLHIGQVSGIWIVGFAFFALTALGILAFGYWLEFAQALVLIALPLSLVAARAFATASRIAAHQIAGEDLQRVLMKQRFWTQVIGVIAVFVTAMFGMYQNLELGAI